MTTHQVFLASILLFPLLGAILNGFVFRRVPRILTVFVAVVCVAVPFLLSLLLVFGPLAAGEIVRVHLLEWFVLSSQSVGDIRIPFALMADRLSGVMLLVVTGVGSLIHLYAAEYMSHEEGVYRFFSYLNLFVFAMLSLVLGSNMLVTFLGWEGVGLCSYLLIGYWYDSSTNAAAGMKAFVVNRVGDFGFLMAIFLCFWLFGSVEYLGVGGAPGLVERVALLSVDWFGTHSVAVTSLGLCILLAVTGKSAQMPLFVWLPDAMAGPTPVSALIHAATMVTAGVFFMTRMSFVLVHSDIAMLAIAAVGAVTAIFAATIGLVQNDIKKVLAYSTVSQLGFMVMACGVGAFQFGIAHLVTHAFFKALLFLGAGSVIYALHHEQDIRKMGGLVKKMPATAYTFVIGTLAIIGFPGFSGFFSKDEILANAYSGPFGHPLFWLVGAVAAACTSFYMVRLTVLVFFGKSRSDHHAQEHVHENSWVMILPLSVLAIFSVVGGLISVPKEILDVLGFRGENFISEWLAPVLAPAQRTLAAAGHEHHANASLGVVLMLISTLIMLVMASFAWKLYKNGPEGGDRLAQRFSRLYRLLLDKWRVDELYQAAIVNPLKKLGDLFFVAGDRTVIEGVVNGVPALMRDVTQIFSDASTGLVRSYAKVIFVGIILIGIAIAFAF